MAGSYFFGEVATYILASCYAERLLVIFALDCHFDSGCAVDVPFLKGYLWIVLHSDWPPDRKELHKNITNIYVMSSKSSLFNIN